MKVSAEDKILRYLFKHPSGVSNSQINAWLDSCRKDGGFTFAEMADAKIALRNAGRIVCTNGLWWLKDIPSAMKEGKLMAEGPANGPFWPGNEPNS